MKIIAMLGDSHTWGEGVGADYSFMPPCRCSDLRMLPFGFPNYVNLIRDAYNISSGSSTKEYYSDKLTSLCEDRNGQFGIIKNKSLVLNEKFAFCRVFLMARPDDAFVGFYVDGSCVGEYKVQSFDTGMNKCICLFNFKLEDGIHRFEISARENTEIYIHRIELYTGEYAVVNCGVGSCTAERYADEYFDHYVKEISPYAIVFEGCTINDWISSKTIEKYEADLERIISLSKAITPKVIMHTVFPIQGSVYYGSGVASYDMYIDAVRNTAARCGIPLADCYSAVREKLNEVPEDKRGAFVYHDKWHPNGTGYYIYAETILPVMKKYIG